MARTEPTRRATIDDLHRVDGKAELIDGAIVHMAPTGDMPSHAGFEIATSLREHARRSGGGRPVTDGAGFVVDLPNRRSFSPDAAWWTGPPAGMRFFDGAPAFAVEVRSEGDYGPAAERAMRAKRADYFAAGTRAVWDVDLLDPANTVRLYLAHAPDDRIPFARDATAHAGDAVPGWSMPVASLFLEPLRRRLRSTGTAPPCS